MYHNPVLLSESVEGLAIQPDGIYVDVTFGGGGHSREILRHLNEKGRLLAFDQDPDSAVNSLNDPRFTFIPANFCHFVRFLEYHHAYPVNGILADLGVSSYQFDTPSRGFSHRYDGILDMRMNTNKGDSAQDVVNSYSHNQLSDMLFRFGELRNAYKIAESIVAARQGAPILTTEDLTAAVKSFLPKGNENKVLSRIFQAIRIEVNHELEVLESFLNATPSALLPGGRLVIISYHSLEDRLVKNFMRSGNIEGDLKKDFYGNPITPFELVTRKAIIPSENEIMQNTRARSAKLRIAEKNK